MKIKIRNAVYSITRHDSTITRCADSPTDYYGMLLAESRKTKNKNLPDLQNRLSDSHRGFLKPLAKTGTRILTHSEGNGIEWVSCAVLNWPRFQLDRWTLFDDGLEEKIIITFLSPGSLLAAIRGSDYHGTDVQPFTIDEVLGVLAFEDKSKPTCLLHSVEVFKPVKAEKVKNVCRVCGWIHDAKLTRFENPKDRGEVYTVTDGSDRHSFLVYLHSGMVDSGEDVSLTEYMEKMRKDGKRPVDILGKDLFSKLFMSTNTDRAKIRPPDFKRQAGRPRKKE